MPCDRIVITQVSEPGWNQYLAGVCSVPHSDQYDSVLAERLESKMRSRAIICLVLRSTVWLLSDVSHCLCS